LRALFTAELAENTGFPAGICGERLEKPATTRAGRRNRLPHQLQDRSDKVGQAVSPADCPDFHEVWRAVPPFVRQVAEIFCAAAELQDNGSACVRQ
jgi:hypothetical protein